jgi:iron complex transport system permease protein
VNSRSFRHRSPLTPSRTALTLAVLTGVLAVSVVFSLAVGSVGVPLSRVLAACTGIGEVSETERMIVLAIRLPRVLLAIVVGAGLSVAGAMLQAILRNPLAEPYILGISSGGTMGTILVAATVAGAGMWLGPAASFAGSALVMFLVYILAHRQGRLDPYTLILAGVMVGAFFNAAVLLTFALFNQELRNAFLWLMGNLSSAQMESLWITAPLMLAGVAVSALDARRYNLIATGEETAAQLGVNVRALRKRTYIIASLITGAVVSVSGVIGFVGLIIPHVCRILFGPDHRILLPSSFLLGGAFLLLADTLARTLIAPAEIPVGAVTAALGAPVFVYLLRRR